MIGAGTIGQSSRAPFTLDMVSKAGFRLAEIAESTAPAIPALKNHSEQQVRLEKIR